MPVEMKTPLTVAFEELERCRQEPWSDKYSLQEFEAKYPHKALLVAEMINEVCRRARDIMKDI